MNKEQKIETEVTDADNLQEENVEEQRDVVSENPSEDVAEETAEEAAERDLEAELQQAVEEKNDLNDKMLRMAADLENYKKRMSRDRDNALKYAVESLVKDLLPTIDNLGRALEHDPSSDVDAFIEGVEMTMKGLLSTLEKNGVTPIDSVGEPFDPNLHEAMIMEENEEIPDQHVIREFEKGYHFKDRLLRAAKVVVSKGGAE